MRSTRPQLFGQFGTVLFLLCAAAAVTCNSGCMPAVGEQNLWAGVATTSAANSTRTETQDWEVAFPKIEQQSVEEPAPVVKKRGRPRKVVAEAPKAEEPKAGVEAPKPPQ